MGDFKKTLFAGLLVVAVLLITPYYLQLIVVTEVVRIPFILTTVSLLNPSRAQSPLNLLLDVSIGVTIPEG